ncbi:MAG: hypothetical protein H0X67_14060 [Acidobacteria bacterium]|nr:hypothetical protein [Acidobacteriota bacterium]
MRFPWSVLMSAVLLVCGPSMLHAQTLVWDANSETNISGYRVLYGTQSGSYPNQVDVGNQTHYQPPQGFDWSRTLYFTVQAYNTSGLSSPLSAELKWVPSAPPSLTSIHSSAAYPLLAGQPVTWTATTTSNPDPLEYRFYLYRKTGWTLARDYGPGNSLTWIPSGGDVGEPYTVQAWVRRVGSSLQYESWLGTPTFAVTGAALELSADVDFPTPPGNQVTWTAHAAFAHTGTLEYKFLVANQNDGVFTVFRNYSASHVAQWTAPAIGRYAVQALSRQVGSTAAFEHRGTTEFFDVSQTPLSVSRLTADGVSPTSTGTKITWTARVKGGMSGPIQYQFWLYSAATGWKLAQPYGSSHTFMWTPTWGNEGEHTVQVWVRNNGSTATHEGWRSSAPLRVERAAMSLTTATLFPAAPGSYVDWRAAVPDPSADLDYQFWVYSATSANWALGRPYDPDPIFRWIPTTTGEYVVQARARQRGSAADYEVTRTSPTVQISQGPAQLVSLASSISLPAAPGTSITWTAEAYGGTAGPLQYQFWRWSNGAWVLVQSYGSQNTYTWTPTAANVGTHALQVWVRSAGSTVSYESYKSTGFFSIQ